MTNAELCRRLRDMKYVRFSTVVSVSAEAADTIDSLTARAEKAEAALRDGWQPIETAPKANAERILLAWPNAHAWVVIGFWSDEYHGLLAWVDDNAENAFVPQPTHWRPLPAPPAAVKGGA